MTDSLNIRALSRADLASVAAILDATGLFPSELLPDMAEPFLSSSADHLWLVICDQDAVVGFAYTEPERMTDRTYNLLAIAVAPDRQNHGIGKRLVQALLSQLAQRCGRILIVETSSLAEFAATRAFYRGLGFACEATIRDFYAQGEDKVVFWKSI